MSDTIESRVARGAALLDERLPGWDGLIDLGRLSLSSPCNCILGQTWGESGFSGAPTAFELQADALDLSSDDEIDYGFNAGQDGYDGSFSQ
jgi:hypothetical protein